MSDIIEHLKFVRCVDFSLEESGLLFIGDYGERFFPWDSLRYCFSVILKKKNIPYPLFILISQETDRIYYIDGNIASTKYFSAYKAKSHGHGTLSREPRKAREIGFQRMLAVLCARLTKAYIDKPLIGYLRGNIFLLPSFATLKEISDYCTRIIQTVSEEEMKGATLLEVQDDSLNKKAVTTRERQEWNEGDMVLDGRFTVQEVKRGGMGTVYIVFDPENVRFLAIKTFQERYLWDERIVKQFIKEAEIWIKLDRHINIVQAELVKVIDGKPHIFLEYIQGTDLEKLTRESPLSVEQSLKFAIQFCEGMHYAFKKLGLIHRDIKPSNCLITREGLLKISDFGLGKIFDETGTDADLISFQIKEKRKRTTTTSTAMVGTLPFMAPELFSSLKTQNRKTDIYSFGVLLYIMLTGTNPFFSEDPLEVISNQKNLTPRNPLEFNDKIPESLATLTLKCLEKNPDRRYSDFSEIKVELESIYRETAGADYEVLRNETVFTEDDWVNKGISLASLGRHREALITFDQALHINESSLRAYIFKSSSLIAMGRIRESLACIEDGMRRDERNWELWLQCGEAHWKLGGRDKAFECFEHALNLTDDKAPILGRKGALLAEMGKIDEAILCYNEALAQYPRASEIWNEKGRLLILLHRNEEALECNNEALRINPRFKEAWYQRGVALFHLGHFQEALSAAEKVLALDQESADAWVLIGKCRRDMDDSEKAMEAWNNAIRIQPDNMDAFFSSISLLQELARSEEALQILDSAIEVEPDSTRLLLKRAELLFHFASYEEALALTEIVMESEPDNQDGASIMNSLTLFIEEQQSFSRRIRSLLVIPRSFSDLNSLLCIYCNLDEAGGVIEDGEDESPLRSSLKASLAFIAGDDEKCLKSLAPLIGNDQFSHQITMLRNLIEERQVSNRNVPVKKGGLIGSFFKKSALDERSAEELLIRGLEKLRRYEAQEAAELLKEAYQKDPRLKCCRFFTGKAYDLQGSPEKAQPYYEDFISQFPLSIGYWKERLKTTRSLDPNFVEYTFHKWIAASSKDSTPWKEYFAYLYENDYRQKLDIIASFLIKNSFMPWSPQGKELCHMKGLLHYSLGNYSSSMKSFMEALEADRSDRTTLTGIGRCHEALSFPQQAQEYYELLLEQEETQDLAGFFVADLYLKRGMPEEALDMVEELLAGKGISPLLALKKAEIIAALGKYSEFFDYCSGIELPDEMLISFKMLRARILADQQRLNDAIAEITGVYLSDPYYLPVAKCLGFLYLRAQNYHKALALFDGIIVAFPLDYEISLGKGITFYLMRNYAEALLYFIKAQELNPFDREIWHYLGATYFHLKKQQESEKCWEKALSSGSKGAAAWANKAAFLYHTGKYREALEMAGRSLYLEKTVHGWLTHSRCHWKLGNIKEAIRSAENAVSHSPHLATCWVLRGLLEFQLKNYETCSQSFEKASKIENKHPVIWYDKALLALLTNSHTEAKKALDRAIALNPSFFEAFIARYALAEEKEHMGHMLLSQAQKADPVKFEAWSGAYESSRNVLATLAPLELEEDPFSLPLNRAIPASPAVDLFHLVLKGR
ncbi:MAG: tetratricopeptide repeat protein [Candidatus Eremiobacteraeota bacterium]|nr:tetratricopeptide repeat protein [Candidatus Eremiobacteraeota bacterium]